MSDSESRTLFWEGVRDSLPIQLGNFPFGVIVGVTAVELGFSTLEVIFMSATVLAGVSQLAAIFLMAEDAHIAIVVLSVILINIRFLMYSASLAPIFQSYSRLRKATFSFFITDPAFALSIPRFRDPQENKSHWYFMGSGVSIWFFFVLGTVVGAGLGIEIPEAFPVNLVFPLVLIALLFPVLEDRPSAAAAIVAGSVATAAAPLNHNLGLLAGVSCGLIVGVSLKR
ncbi:AzlC family ABC transporter permease [Halorarius litoreus]|uniref:AzlC family ABC transporter permease n=1 Tax=Halorarius litoreus TaxID=2962676 RepID=UPI0020CEABB9|nr:AzlC family ABC transporter permease [Halorarius litoreus]